MSAGAVTPDNIGQQDAGEIARVGRYLLLPENDKAGIVEMVVYVWES